MKRILLVAFLASLPGFRCDAASVESANPRAKPQLLPCPADAFTSGQARVETFFLPRAS